MPQQRGNSFDRPSAVPEFASFADRLQARRRELPDALKRVVGAIEEDPHLLVEGTITELASTAEVSPSAVTRLSRALGYPSVARMRMACARDMAVRASDDAWLAGVGEEFAPDDDPRALLEKLTAAHLGMIRNTAGQLDTRQLGEVAERIAAADLVDVYAIGASANAARMFAIRAFRIGIPVRVWDEVHGGLVSASFLGESSVAIAVSRSGRTPEVAQLIRAAGDAGALTVAMVGNAGSRIAAAADITVSTMASENPGGGDMTPRYSQGFALDYLFLLLARLDVAATSRRLAAGSLSVERHRRASEAVGQTEPST